jgi:hypothetical protein
MSVVLRREEKSCGIQGSIVWADFHSPWGLSLAKISQWHFEQLSEKANMH